MNALMGQRPLTRRTNSRKRDHAIAIFNDDGKAIETDCPDHAAQKGRGEGSA
jgi:hypothetical protein